MPAPDYAYGGGHWEFRFVPRKERRVGDHPKYQDFHPDHRPSDSRIFVRHGDGSNDVLMVLEVKDWNGRRIGALTMRATEGHPDGRLRFEGVGEFTWDEVVCRIPK